jgi:hypothetical protein
MTSPLRARGPSLFLFVANTSRYRSRRHTAARLEPLPAASRAPLYRRLPWLAIGTTLVVLLAAWFAEAPIRDAVTLGPITEAHLELSVGYLAIAPFSDVLDTLSLLGVRQHIAVVISAIVIYILVRIWRNRRERGETGEISAPGVEQARRLPRAGRESGYSALFLLAIVATYAVVAVMPRPMAALGSELSDVILSADFHSHTRYSHDGRPGWDPADVRAWHRAAGFDVAFISDHRTVQGAELGIADNPPEAGQGTTLLQALEVVWRGERVNILGAGRTYKGLTTPDLRDVDEQAIALASLLPAREPMVIETLPGNLSKIPFPHGPRTPGVRAIELVDGSPRGLDQTRILRSRIVHLADSLNLALVAGTDNHGWGRAVPGWTLLAIPGWRGMGSDSLAFAIERALRVGRTATKIVERRIAGELNGGNALELTLSLPIVVWRMFTTLSFDERVMWIIWVWAFYVVTRLTVSWRRRRQLRGA